MPKPPEEINKLKAFCMLNNLLFMFMHGIDALNAMLRHQEELIWSDSSPLTPLTHTAHMACGTTPATMPGFPSTVQDTTPMILYVLPPYTNGLHSQARTSNVKQF